MMQKVEIVSKLEMARTKIIIKNACEYYNECRLNTGLFNKEMTHTKEIVCNEEIQGYHQNFYNWIMNPD